MTEHKALWLTVSEAADRLHRSQRTVRRYIDLGRLPIDRTRTPFCVDIGGEALPQAGKPDISDTTGEVARLQELLDEVRADRDYLRQALATALSTRKLIEAPGERVSIWERLGLQKRHGE